MTFINLKSVATYLLVFVFIALVSSLQAQKGKKIKLDLFTSPPLMEMGVVQDNGEIKVYTLTARHADSVYELYKLINPNVSEVDLVVADLLELGLMTAFEKEPEKTYKIVRGLRLAIPLAKIAIAEFDKKGKVLEQIQKRELITGNALELVARIVKNVDEQEMDETKALQIATADIDQ